MRALIRAGLVAVLAAGCVAYLAAQSHITLVDAGATRAIDTFAPTVSEVLRRADIELASHDRVTPAMADRIGEGSTIEIFRGRAVTLVVNGSRQSRMANGTTVKEVLREVAVNPDGAGVFPALNSRVAAGEEIIVNQAVQVVLVQAGKSSTVAANEATVGSLLRRLDVAIGPQDRVEPSIFARPAEGETIKVIRVTEGLEKVTKPIAFKRVSEKSASVDFGFTKLKSSGADGVRTFQYKVVYEDGRVKARTLIRSDVTKAPVDEVTLVGTRRPILTSVTSSQTGKGTWYKTPGLTAAHRTLPFGTAVRVTNVANGKQVTVKIADRGPYGDGRIIDLSDLAFSEIAPLGAGVINVKIEW